MARLRWKIVSQHPENDSQLKFEYLIILREPFLLCGLPSRTLFARRQIKHTLKNPFTGQYYVIPFI